MAETVTTTLAEVLDRDVYSVLDPTNSVESVSRGTNLVVCDLHLIPRNDPANASSRRSGPSAVRYLVDDRDAQVLAMSGKVPPAVVTAALAAGARSFVAKERRPRPNVWIKAVHAVAGDRKYVTATLAADLLTDARNRPLEKADDFSEEAQEFLRDVLKAADQDELLPRRWAEPTQATILSHIWRVAARRDKLDRLTLKPGWLEVAPLLAAGLSQKEIGDAIGYSWNTVRDRLNNVKQEWEKTHGKTKAKGHRLLLGLYRQYVEENGLRYGP